jgi:AcrR family transcriptional regulator
MNSFLYANGMAADSQPADPRPLRPLRDPGAGQLPRHRHGLTRAEIVGSQRGRLVAATADVVAERGYAGTTVAAIAASAGVSTKTFYEFFENKEAAFLGAYETIDLVIERMIAAAAGDPADPPPGDPRATIARAVGSYLETLASEPAFTRMLVIEALGAGPRVLERRQVAFERIAAMIEAPLRAAASEGELPMVDRRMLIGMLGAINELCVQHIVSADPRTLPEIGPDVERLTARICFGD